MSSPRIVGLTVNGKRIPPCAFCDEWHFSGGTYEVHWGDFKANCTSRQAGYVYIKTYIRPNEGAHWRLLEENATRYLRFAHERHRLERQLLTGHNDLTRSLPTEIVELIWMRMKSLLRVHLSSPVTMETASTKSSIRALLTPSRQKCSPPTTPRSTPTTRRLRVPPLKQRRGT